MTVEFARFVQGSGLESAIEAGWIDQLVLAVYVDPNEPTNVIEAWRFKFGSWTDQNGVVNPTLQVCDRDGNLVADEPATVHTKDSIARSAQDILKSSVKMELQYSSRFMADGTSGAGSYRLRR